MESARINTDEFVTRHQGLSHLKVAARERRNDKGLDTFDLIPYQIQELPGIARLANRCRHSKRFLPW